jgi:hypothetical protein
LYKGFDYGPTNEYPSGVAPSHDYTQLEPIYAHSHQSTTNFGERTAGAGTPAADPGLEGGNSPANWGRAIDYDGEGRPHVFEKSENGRKIITFVFWAIGEGPRGGHNDH